MTMIEQIARALAKESGVSDWRNVPEQGEYDSRDYWNRLATAALEAMREPTESMLAAANAGQAHEYNWDTIVAPPSRSWPAMIEAALTEKSQ